VERYGITGLAQGSTLTWIINTTEKSIVGLKCEGLSNNGTILRSAQAVQLNIYGKCTQ